MSYNMTTDQIELYLKDVHEYNQKIANDPTAAKDGLQWMGESIETLYRMCLKYDHCDPEETVPAGQSLKVTRVIRSNRMIEKYFLNLYKTEYVFLSGIYIPLDGLVVGTDQFSAYLKGLGTDYDEVRSEYLLSAGQYLTHKNVFIPKISDYVPNPLNTSKSYRLITL